jgi:hypothetical protein
VTVSRLTGLAAAVTTAALARAGPGPTGRQPVQTSPRVQWSFTGDPVGAPPQGFVFARSGRGRVGRWVVRRAADAPSPPNVLAQEDADRTDDRFPIAVAAAPSLADVAVSVRCRPAAGTVDQACGLVWRYRDADNYYVARANALENNVRIYYVKDGERRQLASWRGQVTSETWHRLRIEAVGDHLSVFWEDAKVLDVRDRTFRGPGLVGVWTKADSQTLFDDLTVTTPDS